ncbi:DUF342 domain-containing protein [candidate division KSB1 bacterium]|nr:DUF342 domain-containing protein [candidate division KSB1 bacterium]
MDDPLFRIISQGYNTWRVQTTFARHVDGATVSHRLAEIKTALARQFNIPEALVEYDCMLKRVPTPDGMLVDIQFDRKPIPAGAPRFRMLPLRAGDGSLFSDMLLEADIYPFDEYDQFITLQVIQSRVAAEGVDLSIVDWRAINQAISAMSHSYEPVFGMVIGQGQLPDIGIHSRIRYGGLEGDLQGSESRWTGCLPVSEGDVLFDVIPASSGRTPGRNLYGRELEPRGGIDTVIDAGEGTNVSKTGARVVAARDGLVVYERFGRDKRQLDSRDVIPARLVVRVEPTIVFDTDKRFELDLFDSAVISANVLAGSVIRSRSSLFIEGQVAEYSTIECHGVLRINGRVQKSRINSEAHICLLGGADNSIIQSGLTAHLEGLIADCRVYAHDVHANDIRGGEIEVLSRTAIQRVHDSEHGIANVRVNVLKSLAMQQQSSKVAVEELRDALAQIIQIFGTEIALQVEDATVQRMLLQWLRKQKSLIGISYSPAEVQDFRTLLSAIPTIRQQLEEVGTELRQITDKLHETLRDSEQNPELREQPESE